MKHLGQLKKEYSINCDLTDMEINTRLEWLNSERERQINYSLMPFESWSFINEGSHFTVEYIVRGKTNIKVKGKGFIRRVSDSRTEVLITYTTSGFGTFVILLYFLVSICSWVGVIYVFIKEYYGGNRIPYLGVILPIILTIVSFFIRSTTISEIIDLHDKVTKALKQEL